ncbi:MAG TPA: hypothetical protein VFY21_05960 [Xanthobacteraceae bacterium]|nr:hypothetical protein [Xanthobacteraceae bacterium]
MRFRRHNCRTDGHAWPLIRARAALTAVALALAACNQHDPSVTGSIATPVSMNTGHTIAFESVDGPPRPVFDRLVAALGTEAERRQLPVVTHTAPSTYRVRAYLATYIEKKKKRATLTWAWEVFDTRENRAFRLAGEEALGAPKADVWGQLDDAVLLKIARQGFDELSARIGSALPATPSPEEKPAPAGPAVAFTNTQ